MIKYRYWQIVLIISRCQYRYPNKWPILPILMHLFRILIIMEKNTIHKISIQISKLLVRCRSLNASPDEGDAHKKYVWKEELDLDDWEKKWMRKKKLRKKKMTEKKKQSLIFSTHLVEPDAEPLEFVLNKLLVHQGLEHVEHNEDEPASPGHGNHLLASALAVLGALDNTRQIQQLKRGRPLIL